MARKNLDLSKTLSPLSGEFQDLMSELVALPDAVTSLFSEEIDHFITKYGGTTYDSLDALLEASNSMSEYQFSDSAPNFSSDLLQDLLRSS